MFAWDIGFWYCCLNLREQAVLRATIIGLADTLYVGIPKPLWDAFWFPFVFVETAYQPAFLSIYKLEIVTIVVDLEEIAVVRPIAGHLPDYISWSLFLITPAAACLDGCGQSSFD